MGSVRDVLRPFFETTHKGYEGRYGAKAALIRAATAYTACKVAKIDVPFLLIACTAGIGELLNQTVFYAIKNEGVSIQLSSITTNVIQRALIYTLNQKMGRTFNQFLLFMGICSAITPIMEAVILTVNQIGIYSLGKNTHRTGEILLNRKPARE